MADNKRTETEEKNKPLDVYDRLNECLEPDRSNNETTNNAPYRDEFEYNPSALAKYTSYLYPAYIRALVGTRPMIQEEEDAINVRFSVIWSIDALLRHDDDESAKYEDSITNFCNKILSCHSKAKYFTVSLSQGSHDGYYIGFDDNYHVIDIRDVMFGYTPRLHILSENESLDDDALHKCAHIHLLNIISDIAQDIYGKPYMAMSRRGAFALCQNLLNKCWFRRTPVHNPALSVSSMLNDTPIENKETVNNIFDDFRNMSALFNYQKSDKPATVLGRIFYNVGLDDQSINIIANILADKMQNKSFLCLPDDDAVHQNENTHLTPAQIYELVSKSVINQEAAVKAASMLVCNHMRGHSRNIVMIGPTGCGKTEIWRTLAKTFPNIVIVNGPNLTAEGWKGDYKVSNIFYEADPKYRNNLIIVIDEADKMFEPQTGSTGMDYATLLQSELLKIMDHENGNMVTFSKERKESIHIDCHNISIVFCGSFDRMVRMKNEKEQGSIGFTRQAKSKLSEMSAFDRYTEDDLVKYANMRNEIVGRVNQVVELNAMTIDDFIEIMNHPDASPVHQLEKEFGVQIEMNDTSKEKLAELAVTSKLGCRTIKSRLTQCVDSAMFDDPSQKTYDLSDSIMASMTANNEGI